MPNLTKIYICLPVTGREEEAKELAGYMENVLTTFGYEPVNPFEVCRDIPAGSPHEVYMSKCLNALHTCDGYILHSGWRSSRGCREEVYTAQDCGMKLLGVFNESVLTLKIKH